jgi:hypothetical protein
VGDLSWFLYRTGNYVLRAVYDTESAHDQLGCPLLKAVELKMKIVEEELSSTAFVPLTKFELELWSNPDHQQTCSSAPKSCRGSALE